MTCVLLHSSGYSSVFLGAATTGKEALLSCFKVYNKDYPLQPRHWLNISRECCILSRLQQERVDGIVQLLSVADTAKHFSLQFKPCLGGNLYQCLERRECCEEQELCVKVIIPLLHVLKDLHSRGIIHRDIKPENVFFEEDGKLVLGDFGLAIDSAKDNACSRVGTPDYMAPEVLAQPSADTMALRNIPTSMLTPYGTAVDIWAVGTLIHEALTGKVPFYHPEPTVMALRVQFGRASRLPEGTSPECQAFVDAVLQQDAAKRPSAAQLLQHPWVHKHAAAAAAAVAARVKSKFLAELQLDRLPLGNTPLSAQASPVAVVAPSRCFNSSLAATAAADKLLQSAGTAGTCAVRAAGAGCADRPAQDATVSSQASMSSSSSGCFPGGSDSSSSAERADSSCRSDVEGSTGSPAAPLMPGGLKQGQPLHAQPQTSKPPCSCKPRKVSFDCTALQPQQQRKGMSVCMAALSAAAAHSAAKPAHAQQQSCQAQLRTSTSGFAHAAAGCSAGWSSTGAAAEPSRSEGAHAPLATQLNLLPALSEPVLVEVPSQPGSGHSGSGAGDACCCCSSPRRTSQSGTCTAAVAAAAAAAAGRMRPHSVHLVAASAAHAQPCGADSGCAGCAGGCAQAEQAVLSAPAHTVALQSSLSGPAPRSLGTLTGFNSARRVVSLGQHSSAGLPPVDIPGGAAGTANRGSAQAKPPLLKASTIAAMPAHPAGGAPSPKAMLFSPPKPAMLMQRLRSMTHRERRRHSFDITAVSAAPAVAPAAAGSPGGISEAAAGNSLPAAASPARELPSPPRQKLRSGAGAGLASPLAALSKLSEFLSPPSAVRSQGVSVPGPGQNGSFAVPAAQAGSAAVQHGAACTEGVAEGGTAALMVGLAGRACADTAAWEVQEGPGGRVSPSQGCRSAKDVCMQVLNQMLRHQQHA